MDNFVIKGIIIREVPYGEADKLLNILTREHGLLTVSAKNARRPKRNMLLSTSALSLCEFEISGSENTRFYLNDAQIIESFQKIRNDVITLTYCAHIMDLVLDAMRDVSSAGEIFALVLHTMNRLMKPSVSLPMIIHTFELKLLFILGFTPLLNSCAICGRTEGLSDNGSIVFSFTGCGLVCNDNKCRKMCGENSYISPATLKCMQYISESTIEKVYSFSLEDLYIDELAKLSTKYICERLDRCYTKLKMLEDIE